MNEKGINIPLLKYMDSGNFLLIAGPCVVECEDIVFDIAEHLVSLTDKYRLPFIFKSSYRKANRTRLDSFTGIGDIKALEMIKEIKNEQR